MSTRRLLGISLTLFGLSACATQQSSQAPAPLKSEAGPKASIRVGYSGGLINRNVTAYFRTEQNAYVLVGHLGGDGVIRVLYPSDPSNPGFVNASKTFKTDMFFAQYDGIPSLFSYTMSPYRSLGSLYDSYDGRGHGYVFLIAAQRPLRSGVLEENGEWIEWDVADYTRSHDPRYAIRDFAEAIARGSEYTLKFASSFGSSHYDAYASQAWDCAMLSALGYFSYSPFWNGWSYNSMGLRSGSGFGNCGYRSSPSARYAWVHGSYNAYNNNPVVIPTTPTTPSEPAPDLDRPGRRGLGPKAGETTRELTATGVGLSKRTTPVERAEIIARTAPTSRPTMGESRRTRPPQDLATRAASDRRRNPDPNPSRGTTYVDKSDRSPRAEPARTASETSRSAGSGSRGSESSRPSSTTRGDGGGRAVTSPRDARKPSGDQ